MKAAATVLLLTALAGCGVAPSEKANAVAAPEAEQSGLVVLCDPVRFRVSIRHQADAASRDRTYPQRVVIDPESLVRRFPHQGGDQQYQDSLIRYETCGPFVIRLQGEFLNGNLYGEMGGYPPFAAFRIWADNRMIYPADARGFVRLAVCDPNVPRFEDCPRLYATRVDLDYRPDVDRVAIREWSTSGDVFDDRDVHRTAERRSEVRALLGLWWGRLHP